MFYRSFNEGEKKYCFIHFYILYFKISHISNNTEYLSFSVGFILVIIITSKSSMLLKI